MRLPALSLAVYVMGLPVWTARAAQPLTIANDPGAAQASALPPSADLRPSFKKLGLGPRRQGDRPTCSVFTVAGALEFATARHLGHCPRLSVEFLNWSANAACGDKADGGFFSDLWKGYVAYGLCDEEECPYQARFDAALQPAPRALADAKARLALDLRLHWLKEWNVHTGLTDAELSGIKRTLADGWPVCSGLRWPKQERWKDAVLQMCPAEGVWDGHSVLLVGYREDASQPGGGVFIFRNTSQDARDGSMPYAYAREYMNDAAWVDCQPVYKLP